MLISLILVPMKQSFMLIIFMILRFYICKKCNNFNKIKIGFIILFIAKKKFIANEPNCLTETSPNFNKDKRPINQTAHPNYKQIDHIT